MSKKTKFSATDFSTQAETSLDQILANSVTTSSLAVDGDSNLNDTTVDGLLANSISTTTFSAGGTTSLNNTTINGALVVAGNSTVTNVTGSGFANFFSFASQIVSSITASFSTLRVQAPATIGTATVAHFSQSNQTTGNATLIAIGTEGGSVYKSGLLFTRETSFDRGRLSFLTNNDANSSIPVNEAMTLKSSGFIGMGNVTPVEKLHVTGNMVVSSTEESINSAIYLGTPVAGASTSANKIALIAEARTSFSRANLHFCLNDVQNNATANNASLANSRMTILSNGNVGIGITAPAQRFHVVGNTLLNSNVTIGTTHDSAYSLSIPTPAAAGHVFLGTSVQNRKLVMWDQGTNNDHQFYGLGINLDSFRYQANSTTAAHDFYCGLTSTTSRLLMKIRGDGNVGIGTSNPLSKLHVAGDTLIDGNLGIGTTLAGAKLHVAGNTLIDGDLAVGGTISSGIVPRFHWASSYNSIVPFGTTLTYSTQRITTAGVTGNGQNGIVTITKPGLYYLSFRALFASETTEKIVQVNLVGYVARNQTKAANALQNVEVSGIWDIPANTAITTRVSGDGLLSFIEFYGYYIAS